MSLYNSNEPFFRLWIGGLQKKETNFVRDRNKIFVFKGTEPLIIFHKGEYLDVNCFLFI